MFVEHKASDMFFHSTGNSSKNMLYLVKSKENSMNDMKHNFSNSMPINYAPIDLY